MLFCSYLTFLRWKCRRRRKGNTLIFDALKLDLEDIEQCKCGIRTQRERAREREGDIETERQRETERVLLP